MIQSAFQTSSRQQLLAAGSPGGLSIPDVPAAYIWSAGMRARSPDLHIGNHAMRCSTGTCTARWSSAVACAQRFILLHKWFGCTPLLQYFVTGTLDFATGLPAVFVYWARWARVAGVHSLTSYPPGYAWSAGACVCWSGFRRGAVSTDTAAGSTLCNIPGMKGKWFLDSTAGATPFAFQYSVTGVSCGAGVNISPRNNISSAIYLAREGWRGYLRISPTSATSPEDPRQDLLR